MKLNTLGPQNKELFRGFFKNRSHQLCAYSFESMYIWKNLFEITWAFLEDNLCVFFKDSIGCFMYLPPQGIEIRPEVIQEAFKIMDSFNSNPDVSRIENVEQADLPFYQGSCYVTREKFPEYLCERVNLVELKGNKLKAKRASLNYFLKHNTFEYLAYTQQDKDECLALYAAWMKERLMRYQDRLYGALLRDNQLALISLLEDYSHLDTVGRVVKIKNKIKAFTFGCGLSQDTFAVLFEVTDLSVKGLAQFIFCEFCRELDAYKYINIMDDSGLQNLARVKRSYQPIQMIPSYIITRNNGKPHQ